MPGASAGARAGADVASRLFAAALAHHRAGDLKRALALYRRVIRARPEHAEAHHFLGLLAHQAGDGARAVEAIRRSVALRPDSAEFRRALAKVLGEEGRIEEAAAALADLLAQEPSSAEAHVDLGNLRKREGRLKEAARHYRAALRLRPGFAGAHYNLGVARQEQGRNGEAARHYREAIRLDPAFAPAHTNLGNLLLAAGRAEEAVAQLAAAVSADPLNADAHYNLANARKAQGAHALAIERYREAVRLSPRHGSALYNLGNALLAAGDADGAIDAYARALSLAPDDPRLHNNLGAALRERGRLAEAAAEFRRALALAPDSAEALLNLGKTERDRGKHADALALLARAVELLPGDPEALAAWASVARDAAPETAGPEFAATLARAFASPNINPDRLARVAARVVRLRHGIGESRGEERADRITDARAAALAADGLFHDLMAKAVNVDPELEGFVTEVRRGLLFRAADGLPARSRSSASAEAGGKPEETWVRLAEGVARQGINNEYVFAEEAEETARIRALAREIDRALADSDPKALETGRRLLAFAMYRPLRRLRLSARLAEVGPDGLPPPLAEIVRETVIHPREEGAIRGTLARFGEIADETSRAVARQYEENPYPRWLASPTVEPATFARAFRRAFPHFAPPDFLSGPLRILVAGSGTGQHPINLARAYPEAAVLAVDLSAASLAYGARKAGELKVPNVGFAQGDLLALPSLGRTFDVIECAGVLHHMAEPARGLAVLVTLLREGGLIRIGLYSARAREGIASAQAKVRAMGLDGTPADIRRFRRSVLEEGAGGEHAELLGIRDFYHTSGVRDLLFHVSERRFTLSAVAEMIREAGLKFVGFTLDDPATRAAYRREFPDDPTMTDLCHWDAFEARHPRAFLGMYDFWCRKPVA